MSRKKPNASRKKPNASLTVADRARRAAANVDLVANATRWGETALRQLWRLGTSAMHLGDTIGCDMLYVLNWVERQRDAATAAVLKEGMDQILHTLREIQKGRAESDSEKDLFSKASTFAWSLRQWADTIEKEEAA